MSNIVNYPDDFIMSPKVDFAFKELMTNDIVRKGFLSAVLNIKDTKIKSTVMLNTNLKKVHEDEKQGILDVRLTMNDNTEINIEIQLAQLSSWADRSLFYDKIEFHLIELPKLPTNSDGSPIYDWAKFISSEDRGDFEMLAKKSTYLNEAYKQLEIISQDEQKRLEYTARQKALYDYNTMMEERFEDGKQQRDIELIAKWKSKGLSDEQIQDLLS
jgi:hypothetical protein